MSDPSSPRRVDVVIVNWNSGRDLEQALLSLERQVDINLRILVVDNASADHSLATAAATGVAHEVLHTGANLGYTGGNNAGFRHLGPCHPTLVANPDVVWTDPNAIRTMLTHLERNADVAAVAPLIREAETGLVEHLDSYVDLARGVAIHTNTHRRAVPRGTPTLKRISWLDGAAVLFRQEALETVGWFDDRYFLLHEDVEWSLRAASKNWTVALATDAEVQHARSSSLGPAGFGAYYYFRNLCLLCGTYCSSTWRWRWHVTKQVARHALNKRSTLGLAGVLDAQRQRWSHRR